MKRLDIGERPDWKSEAEDIGFSFHTMYGLPYWDERRAYSFSLSEIEDEIEDPTQELIGMCYEAAGRIVSDRALMERLAIPPDFHDAVRASWNAQDLDLYGRFDLAYGQGGRAKMLELNADTPTSLFEASVVQWKWLEGAKRHGLIPDDADQFNSIHERLLDALRAIGGGGRMHFAAFTDSAEDYGTVAYLADCAAQAGLEPTLLDIKEIGVDAGGWFTDLGDRRIEKLFKLYPLEDMMREEFGANLMDRRTAIVEPLWKAVLSNKGLLPVLWELFPDHPNLLPAYFEDDKRCETLSRYARKPLLSREGANVSLVGAGRPMAVEGPYGAEGFVRQELCMLPKFGDDWAVIGSWIVAGQACGIGIREDDTAVTRDTSRFVPHFIEG